LNLINKSNAQLA